MRHKFLPLVAVLFLFFATSAHAQEDATPTPTPVKPLDSAVEKLKEQQAQISDKQQEITQLEQKINALKSSRDTVAADAEIISSQVKKLSDQLAKAELELNQTQLGIQVTATAQKDTQGSIDQLTQDIDANREKLQSLLQSLYEQEQVSWVTVFFDTWSLSDVLADRAAYTELQNRTIQAIQDLHQKTDDLNAKAQQLEDQHQQLSVMESSLASQQADIDNQKKEQQKFLQAKRDQQIAYEGKIAEVEAAKAEIKKQIFTLQSGGVTLSLNNAFDMARYASKLTGVRAALLLAVLKVESGLGANVGSGHYPDSVLPSSRPAFLRITAALGLDPYKAPVSRSGAMGPAQIMPATWEGIAPRLGTMLNKPTPDPYNLTDAFVATAIFLADKGATNPATEREAIQRYNAGIYWQSATRYGDIVLAVAAQYAAQGL